MRNDRYGKGLENDYFDWTSIVLAAKQCDQTVPYTTTPTTGKAYVFDGIIETSNTLLGNIKSILSSFKGIMPYQQGKYYLLIEHGGDPYDITAAPSEPEITYHITQDFIVGGFQIQGESKDRKLNQMRVTYVDTDADYQPNDVLWPDDNDATYTTYLSEDIVPLTGQLTLPYCTSRERALNYAETSVKTSRNKAIINFRTTLAAGNISVGDIVRVSSYPLNFDGLFRILTVNLSSSGTLGFTAVQHNPSDYVLNGHAAEAARPVINLPDPLQVIAPTAVTVASGAAYNIISNSDGYLSADSTVVRLYVSWTATTDPYAREYIVQYKLSADSEYITAGLTNDVEFYIANVPWVAFTM
jgi:predicted phage tail protein